jgi:hypothetical protein
MEATAEAVALTPADSPYRGERLGNHAHALRSLYGRDHDPETRDRALASFAEGTATPTAPILLRARLGRSMARLAGQEGMWTLADQAWTEVLGHLPALADRHLLVRDRQEHLRLMAGLGEAAAVRLRLDDVDGAWDALEAGRGVLLSQALQTRADTSELRARDRALYERFVSLRAVLNGEDGAADMVGSSAGEAARLASARRVASAEWTDLLATIRRLPGLTRFGQPPGRRCCR